MDIEPGISNMQEIKSDFDSKMLSVNRVAPVTERVWKVLTAIQYSPFVTTDPL